MKKTSITFGIAAVATATCLLSSCSTINYLNTSVPEEGGLSFIQLSSESDNVLGPVVSFDTYGNISRYTGMRLALSPDGERIAYLAQINKANNVMLRSTRGAGSAVQRTFRNNVSSVTWSPDGKTLCFTEAILLPATSYIYTINADKGSVVQRISPEGVCDYNPIFSKDCNQIYFHRADNYACNIWGYDRTTNLFSTYSRGFTPYPTDEEGVLLCTRNQGEIWRIDYASGAEEVILASNELIFFEPQLSPDGKWILCSGAAKSGDQMQRNLNVYVVGTDGNNLIQLTFHPGHDTSAVWSKDGKDIYFLSQRGNQGGRYNIWRMNFNIE